MLRRFHLSTLQAVVTLVIIILALYSLFNALTSPRGEAAGWWQVFLVVIGLPILFRELNKMREEQRHAVWKPEISIGIVRVGVSLVALESLAELPYIVETSRHTGFTLVVRNKGKLAAKNFKIYLTDESQEKRKYDDPFLDITPREPFRALGNGQDYLYQGEVLYSQATELFIFEGSVIRAGDDFPPYQEYPLCCTVYADGLDSPVVQHLKLIYKVGIASAPSVSANNKPSASDKDTSADSGEVTHEGN